MSAKLNGMTEQEIRTKHAELREVSRQSRSTEDIMAAEKLHLMLVAIDDAKFIAMSPSERKQHHIDSGIIPYDDSLYTDTATANWNKKYATAERRIITSQVEL